MSHRYTPFAIAFAVFVLDRITKMAVKANISAWQTIVVIPHCLNLVHAENSGVAFGLFSESGGLLRTLVLIGVSVAVLAFITVSLLRAVPAPEANPMFRIALAFVLGGALGNLYDRIVDGTVTDFIEVYTGQHFFPAFNVADSAITVGAAFLLIDMLLRERRNAPATRLEQRANEPG